jgi:hypothetical protein
MSASVTEVLNAYPPRIALAPATLTFVVDEGRGFSWAQQIQLSNNGVLGSLLDAVVSTTDPYVTIAPASLKGLAAGVAGHFLVSVDSTHLNVVSSPYTATVYVGSATASNSPQVVDVSVEVRPKAVIALVPEVRFSAILPFDGVFDLIPPQVFSAANAGPATSVLEYQIRKLFGLSSWLTDVEPIYGVLAGGQSDWVRVKASAQGLAPGVYREILRISGYSLNMFTDVPVTLTVS